MYLSKQTAWLMNLLLFIATPVAAQVAPAINHKTVQYIASDGHVLPGPEGADHRVERIYRDSISGVVQIYSDKGLLKMSTPYAHLDRLLKLGPQTTFYENGQVHSREDYVGNKRNGEFVVYYPDGSVKRRETYVADARQTGNCFAPDGSKVAFYEYNVLPIYQGGGTKEIIQAIAANVHYPAEALRARTQGRVFVAFRVSISGEVENVKVMKGVSAALDVAAVAAVEKLGTFVPGKQDGEIVAVSFTVPVTFAIKASPPSYRLPTTNGPY